MTNRSNGSIWCCSSLSFSLFSWTAFRSLLVLVLVCLTISCFVPAHSVRRQPPTRQRRPRAHTRTVWVLHRMSSSSISFTQCRHRPSPSLSVVIVHRLHSVSSSSISFTQCRHRPSPSLGVVIVHLLHSVSSSSIAFTQCRHHADTNITVHLLHLGELTTISLLEVKAVCQR